MTTTKETAKIAFDAIIRVNRDGEPMDGDETADVCVEILRMLDEHYANI